MSDKPEHSVRALVVATMAARALGLARTPETVANLCPTDVIDAHHKMDRHLMDMGEAPEHILFETLTHLDIDSTELDEEGYTAAMNDARKGVSGTLYWALAEQYGAARRLLTCFLRREDLAEHYREYSRSERAVRTAFGLPALAL